MPDRAPAIDFVVAAEEGGQRLDRALANHLAAISRSRVKALIVAGEVTVNSGAVRDPAYRVHAGERIALRLPPPEPAQPTAEPIPLAIVYEDDALIVVDKPAGLVVHPAAGNWTGTLVNALIAHCGESLSGIGGVRRPGIVHRLDKDTSGLIVAAKTDRAHRALAEQFADHGRSGPLERGYLALVWGVPDRPKGTIDAPLERHPVLREKRAVRLGGRPAITHWEVRERYHGAHGEPLAALLECRLETGRTHQIRVHLAHIGHPIIGDALYGAGFRTKAALLSAPARSALEGVRRQALHAYLLGLDHPMTHKHMTFKSEFPRDLQGLRAALSHDAAEGRNRAKN